MTSETQPADDRIEMPRPTAWPLVVAVGLAFALAGLALSYAMLLVGAAILLVGLVGWIAQLLPGAATFTRNRSPSPSVPNP